MRTTLTLDDDLAGILRRRAAEQGLSFKEVLNAAVRSGLTLQVTPDSTANVPEIPVRDFGFKAGLDLEKLNQLADELDAEEFARKYSRQ